MGIFKDRIRLILWSLLMVVCAGCSSEYDEICDNQSTREELAKMKIAGDGTQVASSGACAKDLKAHLQKEKYKRFVFWVQKCVHGRSQKGLPVGPCFEELITFWGPDPENVKPEDHVMEVELKLAYFLIAKKPNEDGFIRFLKGDKDPGPQKKQTVNQGRKTPPVERTPTYLPEPDFGAEELRPAKRSKKKKKSKKRRKKRRSQREK